MAPGGHTGSLLGRFDGHCIWKTGRCTCRRFTISFSSNCVAMHSQTHCCNQEATYSSPKVQDKPCSFHSCCIRDLQQVTPSPPGDWPGTVEPLCQVRIGTSHLPSRWVTDHTRTRQGMDTRWCCYRLMSM